MKKIRRIPTILGLLLILVGTSMGVIAIRQGSSWFLRAQPETIPKQVKITNITDTSFAVSWVTDGQATGFVKYGSDNDLSFTASDDRDQTSGTTGKYFTHHITVKNLKPITSYSLKLGSGGKLFDNNGQPYRLTTASAIQAPPPPSDVAYGTVIKADGSPASGAIIYLSLANTTPQSTLAKASGSWVIPLNIARSADLTNYTSYDKDASVEEIFVQAGTEGTATAVATTRYDSPLPSITLGQSYDFRKPAAEVASEEATPSSKFTIEELATPSATVEELTITNPTEKEAVNTTKPAILGTAPAGETLTITIESPTPQSGTVVVDTSGDWEWNPPQDLEPGEHTITVSYTDEEGIIRSISRIFTVLAAGTEGLPAFEATPSATATPTPSPSPSPTPSPTATPITTPTATPTATPSVPSTEAAVPEPGYLTPTFLLLIMGIGLILLGSVSNILFKKNG